METTPPPAPSMVITKITPINPRHCLFGRVLDIIRADAEWVYAELKDGIHFLEVRFHKTEIQAILPTPAAPPVVPPTNVLPMPPAPSVTVPAEPLPPASVETPTY